MAVLTMAAMLEIFIFACAHSPSSPNAAGVEGSVPLTSVEGQQIKISSGEVEVIITLNASRAAADLVAMPPLELELIERNGFAKGIPLPQRLSHSELLLGSTRSETLDIGIPDPTWLSFTTIFMNRPLWK